MDVVTLSLLQIHLLLSKEPENMGKMLVSGLVIASNCSDAKDIVELWSLGQ
jgi:hypothetical protein